MTLLPGSRLGPYEIVAPLGAGGMGEVYRARDTRLDRAVAIKIIPRHLSASSSLRQRFEREAKAISQLSHPHICTLFDVGRENGTDYLVMELLEGQTLADRLRKGALPLDQALRCGVEIADALHAAHRQGIVHRDLKPGNLMLTPSGVKVLDFGLARVLAPPPSASVLTAMPTETPLTGEGSLVGTIHYMSPEQLEGNEADARSDIFALGLVLYEMTTGSRAFRGPSHASLIGSILRDEAPPISRSQPVAPHALDRVVSICLAKAPDDRWQTARDVALQLEGIRREPAAAEPAAARPAGRARAVIVPWLVAAAGVAVAIFGLMSGWRPAGRPMPMQSFLVPPPNTTFHVFGAGVAGVAVSPDGHRVAFGTREADGSSRLWIRELSALDPYPLPGTEGALFPFWSPDSRSLGFFSKGRLKIVEVSPSPPSPRGLADAPEPRGGSWNADGTILYSPGNMAPLMRVSVAGGTPVAATRLDRAGDETAHRWPHFLPDGRRFLYEIRKAGPENAPLAGPRAIFVGSLDGDEKREIFPEGTSAAYVSPGYLLFRRAGHLMAAGFDLKSLTVTGAPVILARDIEGFGGTGTSVFSVSADVLVYSPRVGGTPARMVRLDRSGREVATIGPPGQIIHPAISPDGRSVVAAQIAAQIEDPVPPDLWLYDTTIGRGMRLTHDAAPQLAPVFSSDSRRVFFSAWSSAAWDIWQMTLPNGKDIKPFLESGSTKVANDVSPDGEYLLYREFEPATRGDLKVIPLHGDGQVRTYLASAADETNGDFSPDGRWVAYASDETGRREIYVASFPDPARRLRVSTEGGAQPRWSRDGKELFYVRAGELVAAPVGPQGDGLTFGEGRALFPLPLLAMNDPGFDQFARYDVTPDGGFLALLRVGEPIPTPLVLINNWTALLAKP